MPGAAAYHRLLLLYPRPLREAYGEEMTEVYLELRRRHGRRVWGRLLLDLAVSVPRTRWESVMSRHPNTRAAAAVAGTALAAGVLLSVVAVGALGPAGLVVPVLLAVLALAQRSRLGRSLRAPGSTGAPGPAAAALAASTAVLGAAGASWLYHVRTYEQLSDGSVVAHNVLAALALLGVLVSAVVLATRLRRRPPGTVG